MGLANIKITDEEALQIAANGGPMDLERWHGMAGPLIERLEYIVYNVFPMPQARPEPIGQQPFPNHSSQANSIPPESSNKENTSPADIQISPQAARTGSPPSGERVPDSQPQPSGASTDGRLPPPLAFLLSAIRSSIKAFFEDKPPHTIQRLAELVLYPTKHYRTLPAYLRAVDRVVSVTSSADIFQFQTPAGANSQTNGLGLPGNNGGAYIPPDFAHSLGSDESLGGALLTPIPWLTNASFESEDANGDAGILVEGTVALPTQTGEEPGTTTIVGPEAEEGAATASPEPSDEVPHARGPVLLGVEDMGLQDGKGVEMRLGTDGAADVPATAAATATQAIEEQEKAESTADKDGDIVLADTKPKEGEEAKKEEDPSTEPQAGNAEPEPTGDSSEAPDAEKKA
ncbi:Protein phosphatase 4 core regulatory subunit R2 [Penicillium cf. griseofulvum]|uniref:Protein phosphatase 4 core regulatory subunit R2 n=1 Tax=Penicillium cf. griseofulvum TaxID=2972120 RepID=A0A9W9T266_9EURO|nr:Protein phosphatase 4 core regulatory subunit R2 [Penicillium cf. griseofulvum]KAJ5440870.1 Protein phosphatase 4 core regulatory subunit R2 [Penicillium cf. griseofulvum]